MRLDREAQRGLVAREPFGRRPEEPQPQRRRPDLVTLREIFRLDERHVDGARTFLLAGLAGDAEVHRLVEARIGEGLRARALVQGRLEGRDARLGRMLGLARDAEARAHDALGGLLTISAVHADRDGLGVIAAGRGNAGIGVADAVSVIGRPVEKGFHQRSPRRGRGSKLCSDSRPRGSRPQPRRLADRRHQKKRGKGRKTGPWGRRGRRDRDKAVPVAGISERAETRGEGHV